ncbi:hypothetical protein EON64_09330 [archaeon]|nr:MAG: hypothetical protein EON64_09330 [archaeon]
MGRDRGRGKGGGRGGGKKMYIDNIEELEKRERDVATVRKAKEEGDDEDSEEEETRAPSETVFAFERKSKADPGDDNDKVAGLVEAMAISNPNREKKPAEKMIKAKNVDEAEAAPSDAGMNRKEREALAAQKAKEDYMRRHLAGETEQAKRELAQLALVRKRREEAAKKREAEGRPAGWTASGVESSSDSEDDEEDGADAGAAKGPKTSAAPAAAPAAATLPPSIAKKKAAMEAEEKAAEENGGGIPRLKAMDIKKMNGDALKDALRERGLDVQGQKKDLIKRLSDYEANRG